jgi:hypothetical protein
MCVYKKMHNWDVTLRAFRSGKMMEIRMMEVRAKNITDAIALTLTHCDFQLDELHYVVVHREIGS